MGNSQVGKSLAPPPPPKPKIQHTNAKKAMSELNMLADLLGNIAEDVAKEGGVAKEGDFKLNLFNDTAMPDGFAAEVTSEKQKFDSKESNEALKGIAASMDLGGAASSGGAAAGGKSEEEDLLDLMDGL